MTAKKAASKSQKKLTFSEARARLDEILEALEREADDVDQLASRIKEASELIRLCRERLSAARHEVRDVVADLAAEPSAENGVEGVPDVSETVEYSAEEAEANADDESDSSSGTLPF